MFVFFHEEEVAIMERGNKMGKGKKA